VIDFEVAVDFVLAREGGYSNDSDDPGGETKYGISKRAHPNVDIANLTIEGAVSIYFHEYWKPLEHIEPSSMRFLVFDSGVQHGVARALRWYRDNPTYNDYLAYRIRFYTRLQTWLKYGRGWMNRIAELTQTVADFSEGRTVVSVLVDNRRWWDRILAAVEGRSGPVAYNLRPRTSGDGLKLDVDYA